MCIRDRGTPPLEFGSFVSVVLEAEPNAGVISIPRAVLQQDDAGQPFVFTATEDDVLALSSVTGGTIAGDRILVSSGLEDGDRVLLSTPRPAVPGVALDVINVTETYQSLATLFDIRSPRTC